MYSLWWSFFLLVHAQWKHCTSHCDSTLDISLIRLIRGPSPRGRGNAYASRRVSLDQRCLESYYNCKDFFFLLLKVVLQAKSCKGGHCNLEGWCRHLHVPQTQKKLHISAGRGRYNPGQRVFAYNSHTVCHTFKNPQIPEWSWITLLLATPTTT